MKDLSPEEKQLVNKVLNTGPITVDANQLAMARRLNDIGALCLLETTDGKFVLDIAEPEECT